MPSRVLETVLTGRNLLSPVLTSAAVDVESFDAKVTAASTRASTAAETSSKAQVTAADRVIAANTRTASSSEAMSAKIAASQAKAAEHTRAFAEVSESSAARSVAAWSSIATKALPVAAAAVAVVTGKMAGDYQQLVTKLETTAGESQKNIAAVSQGMLDMAGQVGVSADELAKGMYTVESAGYHGRDALLVEKAAAEGAKQENADLAKVADAVSTALHDYHLPASKAANVTSELVDAVAHGKTTFDELTGSLHSITPLASVLHISLADVTGTLAAMTASGESADQATQNMADTLRHLANPSNTMIAELAQLGISTDDLSASLSKRGLAGTLQYISDTIVQHVDPATQKVLLPALNQSKSAAADLQIMIGKMPPSLAQMSRGLLDGSVSIKDYTKGAKDLGGVQGAMATNFLGLYKSSDGFNNVLKAGGPAAQVFEAALAKSVGTAAGLNVMLQTTGENAAATSQNIKDIGNATAQTDGNIRGWADVQGNLNQKMAEAGAEAKSLAIELGQHVLPAATATFGWIASTGLPAVEHLGSAVGGAVHDFSELPAPVKATAEALAGIKLAQMVGLWGRLGDGTTGLAAGFRAAAAGADVEDGAMARLGASTYRAVTAGSALSDEIKLQQALFAMEERNANAAAVSVERLGRAEQAAATWAASAASAGEATAAAESAASARRLAAIDRLTVGARNVTPALSGAQQIMAQWDRTLANEAPQAAALAEGGIGRFRAGLGLLGTRALPAVKSGLSGFLGLLGGPWGAALIGVTAGIVGINAAFAAEKQRVEDATASILAWKKAQDAGGQGAIDATEKLAGYQKKIDDAQAAYDKAAKAADGAASADTGYSQGVAIAGGNLKDLKKALTDAQDQMSTYRASLTPVQTAQAALTSAQNDFNYALAHNPPDSLAVAVAAGRLHDAQRNLAVATQQANDAMKTQSQREQDAATAALNTLDAQRQAQLAQLDLKDAVDQYNTDVASGTVSARSLQREQLTLVGTAEQTAKAAADAAVKQAQQNGATDTGALSQAAYRDALQKAADQMTGPSKKAVEDLIKAMGDSGGAADILAGKFETMGFNVSQAWQGAAVEVAGATDSQIKNMQDLGYQVLHLPNGHIIVSADTNPAVDEINAMLVAYRSQVITLRSQMPDLASIQPNGQGSTSHRFGLATGGVLPGFTPGRDVHSFYSPTGGRLDLSGGEAVMRPEFTAAVGAGWVHSMNAAARAGGVSGVRSALGMADGGVMTVGHETVSVHMDTSGVAGQLDGLLAPLKAAAAASPYAGMVPGASSQAAVQLGARMAAARGWLGPEFMSLVSLWNRESGWNPYAVNPSSGAYGIPQALGHGHPFNLGDIAAQETWGMNYIAQRYGTPSAAWAHEQAVGWYRDGTNYVPADQLAVLHKGEAVIPASQNQGAPYTAMPGYGQPITVTVAPQITVAIDGAAITGRLELGADGFIHLIDGRVRQAQVSFASDTARNARSA